MTDMTLTTRPPTRAERLAIEIAEFRKRTKLDSWASFIEPLGVPSDLYPGIMTNRPELLRLARPRALTSGECAVLYKLLIGVIETNQALREHTERTAQFVDNWMGQITGLIAVADSIKDFANFRAVTADEEQDAA